MTTIICLHGITNLGSEGIENYDNKHISIQNFERQVQQLLRTAVPISLTQFITHLQQDAPIPNNSVVFTFDDGYENNCTVAYPVLRRYQIPATFFLSTGLIETANMFWVDQVEYIINRTPENLLSHSQIPNHLPLTKYTERIAAVTLVKAICKRLNPRKRQVFLEELLLQSKLTIPRIPPPNYRVMNWTQVRELAKDPLISFGAHTVNHEILTNLSQSEIEFEVSVSRSTIEDKIQRSVTSFAYPNGGAADYDSQSEFILRSAGYTCAVTTLPGRNTNETPIFELRREGTFPC